jgi:hypothetical protein
MNNEQSYVIGLTGTGTGGSLSPARHERKRS